MEERIGHYRIVSRLGAGGMGEVYLAQDEQLDRQVAIKRIRQDAASPRQRERFRREARLAARLNHSAVVHVYDLLTEGDVDYLILEYVEGTDLRTMVRQGPLPVSRVLDLGSQIARGLQEAHRQGIVHRDLKTENVLVTPSGQAKIADFGIAKRFTEEPGEGESLTRTDAVLGTYRAMSPEQARGAEVDHRSDLFSFGVLLYELLTGHSPFEAENALATVDRIVHHRPAPVAELNPAVPEGLSRLIGQLLEKDPVLRPRSAGEVVAGLEGAGGRDEDETGMTTALTLPPGEPAAGGGRPDSALEASRQRPRLVVAVGLLLATLMAAGYLALRPPEPPVYVAVLRPEIGAGRSPEMELLASGVRVALLQKLISLEGISPLGFEEVDAASGSARQVARAVAADELVGSRLDCRAELCRVALTRRRGGDGSILWAESFEVPTDESSVVANVVGQTIRRAYAGHDARQGVSDATVPGADLDEFLRLRQSFEERREPSQDRILEGLRSLRRRSPEFLDVYLLEARVLRRRYWASRDGKDFDAALALVQQAREKDASDPRPLFELVDLALEGGKLDLAERSLDELAPLVPGDARLLERRARFLSAQGQGGKALAMMREAARLQPSAKRLHTLAQMEFREGRIAAARSTLESLFRRSPGYFDGLSLLAQIELSAGDLNRAVQLYHELVSRSPGLAELSSLGLAYLFLGRYSEATEINLRLFETQPSHPVLALNLADCYLLEGRKTEAEALYRQVVELVGPSTSVPQLLTVKAQALAHLGRGPQAVAALQEALRLAPDQGPVAFEASLVYVLLGEQTSALVNADKAIHQGIGARWFSLPWFAPLQKRADFQRLLAQARPGPLM